jgi:hypothetical protein
MYACETCVAVSDCDDLTHLLHGATTVNGVVLDDGVPHVQCCALRVAISLV